MPHIVITNDDGIFARDRLVEGVEGLGTISVKVAPSHERSAAAQSLTLRQPIYRDQVAEREWAVEGTPADSMIIVLHALFPEKPDLVISGINGGGNLGENVYYSGTVGAAMEAAINHVPAIAISLSYRGKEFNFEPAANCMLARAAGVEGRHSRGSPLNVNVPNQWKGEVRFTVLILSKFC